MTVLRQSLRNRVVHWGIALSCFGLIATGILQMPVAKRYGLTVLAPAAGDYFLTLAWHYGFAAVFVFLCILHLIVHALEGDFDIVPRRGDLKKSMLIVKAMYINQTDTPLPTFSSDGNTKFALTLCTAGIAAFGVFSCVYDWIAAAAF